MLSVLYGKLIFLSNMAVSLSTSPPDIEKRL
nr:MAG TPA: hypothetical protein [Caudoviricetes sp.]